MAHWSVPPYTLLVHGLGRGAKGDALHIHCRQLRYVHVDLGPWPRRDPLVLCVAAGVTQEAALAPGSAGHHEACPAARLASMRSVDLTGAANGHKRCFLCAPSALPPDG